MKLITGSVTKAVHTFEAFRASSRSNLVIASNVYATQGKTLDISWLKAAAPTYEISSDIKDYVIPVVPIVTSDIPNRNLQGFTFKELSRYDWLKGHMVYQSFIGKMTTEDHVNEGPLCAKGVIFDASLHFVPKYNVWKVVLLCGYDRTKDPTLANDILKQKRNGHSMGAFVDEFKCSICGANQCECGKGNIIKGKLAYHECYGVNYIESSSVEAPADVTAEDSEVFGF